MLKTLPKLSGIRVACRGAARRLLAEVRSTKGAAAIEMALVTPVIALLAWGGWHSADTWRIQNALNRQTAWLAEMLVNQRELVQPAAEGELPYINPLISQLPSLTNSGLLILTEAVGSDTKLPGLRVTYMKVTRDADDPNTVVIEEQGAWSAGQPCGQLNGLAPLDQQAVTLTPNSSGISSRLLRIEACIKDQDPPLWEKLTAPEDYLTSFTVMRKNEDVD